MFMCNCPVINWFYKSRIGLDIGLLWREVARYGLPLVLVTVMMMDDYLEVDPRTALANVAEIEIDPLVEGNVVTIGLRLPAASKTLLYKKALAFVVGALSHLARGDRARPHSGGAALEGIHKLRELVQRRLADDATHARDRRIVM